MRFVFIGKWLDCIILVGFNKDSAIMLNSYCLGGKNHKKQYWRRRALERALPLLRLPLDSLNQG